MHHGRSETFGPVSVASWPYTLPGMSNVQAEPVGAPPPTVERMSVRADGGHGSQRYVIAIRGHEIAVDQPEPLGGDSAPTPTELWVAGLASCVAFYAGRYCQRHDIDPTGLAVHTDWVMSADRPARVARIDVRITPPSALPAERVPALLAVANHCTVHNSLEHIPAVTVGTVAGT